MSEVSERVSNLIREEIELAKAEVGQKASHLVKGVAVIAAGAVFGLFALFIGLQAAAWGIDAALVQGAGDIWLGFLIVFGALAILAVISVVVATRLFKRGAPPTPTMAIDEAKRIRETVAVKTEAEVAAKYEVQS